MWTPSSQCIVCVTLIMLMGAMYDARAVDKIQGEQKR